MGIKGNTVGTTTPRPNWLQDNPAKADYIKNKPDIKKLVDTASPTIVIEQTDNGAIITVQDKNGVTTAKIINGKDGVGIVRIENVNNELVVTLSDSSVVNLGNIKGLDGINGKDGQDGADGADGADGLTPYINKNGTWQIGNVDTGVKAKGVNGTKGDSAYDVAVKNGFEGSELEWLKSLKGDVGDPATNIVQSVNGKSGEIVLGAEDIKLLSGETVENVLREVNTVIDGIETLLSTI